MTGWQQPAPGEQEAGERVWAVVGEAFAERIPTPRRRDWRPVALVAVAAAIVAAAVTSPGQAVLGSLRDAVRGERNAKPALFSLPAKKSQLLVNSAAGAWVVRSDGSKRLLAGYRDASWSPHGLYLAAIQGDELRALEPDGRVHWSIGRFGLAAPRWSAQGMGDERIAYLARGTLRVIGGDGRGDRALARNVAQVPVAWVPRTHVLAYVDGEGRVVVRDADSGAVQWTARAQQRPAGLDWSGDGRYLLVRGPSSLTVFGRTGAQRLEPLGGPRSAPVLDAAFMPSSHAIAFVQGTAGRSVLWFYPQLRPDGTAARRVFAGAGRFDGVAWSPDARWLLLNWTSADQWLFIRSATVRNVIPVSGIDNAFGPDAHVEGWCCP
jgi:Tol biopolymer transport system component